MGILMSEVMPSVASLCEMQCGLLTCRAHFRNSTRFNRITKKRSNCNGFRLQDLQRCHAHKGYDPRPQKDAETRDRTGDLQIFGLTLSQLSYRGGATRGVLCYSAGTRTCAMLAANCFRNAGNSIRT